MVRFSAAVFALVAAAAVQATTSQAPKAAPNVQVADKGSDRDKMVCKRFLETGSLVRGHRVCKTKWEWEQERLNIRALGAPGSCSAKGESGVC